MKIQKIILTATPKNVTYEKNKNHQNQNLIKNQIDFSLSASNAIKSSALASINFKSQYQDEENQKVKERIINFSSEAKDYANEVLSNLADLQIKVQEEFVNRDDIFTSDKIKIKHQYLQGNEQFEDIKYLTISELNDDGTENIYISKNGQLVEYIEGFKAQYDRVTYSKKYCIDKDWFRCYENACEVQDKGYSKAEKYLEMDNGRILRYSKNRTTNQGATRSFEEEIRYDDNGNVKSYVQNHLATKENFSGEMKINEGFVAHIDNGKVSYCVMNLQN